MCRRLSLNKCRFPYIITIICTDSSSCRCGPAQMDRTIFSYICLHSAYSQYISLSCGKCVRRSRWAPPRTAHITRPCTMFILLNTKVKRRKERSVGSPGNFWFACVCISPSTLLVHFFARLFRRRNLLRKNRIKLRRTCFLLFLLRLLRRKMSTCDDDTMLSCALIG